MNLNAGNFRGFARKIVAKYEAKGMLVDAMAWAAILDLYDAELGKDKQPASDGVKPPPAASAAPTVVEVPEDNIGILLRAAGWKTVKATPRRVYGFLLRHQAKAWDAPDVAVALGISTQKVSHTLAKMARVGAITRVGAGQYRAS